MADNTKCLQRCRITGMLIHCWWGSKIVHPLWKTVWQCFIKLNTHLSHDPVIPLPGLYQRKQKHISTQKLVHENLSKLYLSKAKNGKQPKCSSISERINKLQSIHAMKYYSTTKRNELWIFQHETKPQKKKNAEWQKMVQENTCCMILFNEILEKASLIYSNKKQIRNFLGSVNWGVRINCRGA